MQYYNTGAVRPSIHPPNTVRPSILPPRLETPDPTTPNIFGGIRRPGVSRRPKFPPRTRPSGQTGDNLEEQVNGNKDLISLIPIDRPSNQPSHDTNKINGNLQDDDDARVLTGGPFIPNFGGGGRPGRPVQDTRIPIDQNTGTGSAILQKVKYN